MKTLWIATVLALALTPAADDETPASGDELAQRAAEELALRVGVWDCRWEFFGNAGEVAGTATGTETLREVFPGRVLAGEMSLPDLGRESRTLEFFEPNLRKLLHVSVGSDGDFWVLEQDVGSDELVARPHTNADGSVTRLRFVTLEHEDDRRVVQMESHTPDGEWKPGFRQTMERRSE